MRIEKQVVSIELAKKLRSLNVKQDSFFYWDMVGGLTMCDGNGDDRFYSAFTVAELGEMLPKWVYSQKNGFDYPKWFCADVEGHAMKPKNVSLLLEEKTEADARARMLIYLLENNLI